MDARQTRPSLMLRLRNRSDSAAWSEFDAQYGELIVRYLRARGVQLCDAQDIRQIVLAKLFQRLPEFDYQPARGRFRDYLGQTVKNALRDWFVRPGIAERTVDPEVIADWSSTRPVREDPVWEREWVDHHFRRAFASLAMAVETRSMEVFEHLLAGRTVADVAAAEGMSVEAVRKIRQRVRTRLSELIRAQIEDEDGGREGLRPADDDDRRA